MNLDIILGLTTRNTARRLLWKQSNGLIIAGGSGSGKSQTATWYATQYALKGAKLIIGEFSAYSPEGDGLADRCEHLNRAMYLSPAREAPQVIEYIDRFKHLAEQRLNGRTNDNFPIVFFIDEFSALMIEYPNDVPVDKLRSMAMTIRKANMKMVIMGQSWSQLGNEIPQLRNAFDHTVIHRLSPNNVKVFDKSVEVAKVVNRLEPGWALKDGDIMYVPSRMGNDNMQYVEIRLREVHTDRALLDTLLSQTDRQTKPTEILENTINSSSLSVDIRDKESLIAFLHQQGKSYSDIRELVRGDNNTLRTLYDKVTNNDNNT